MKKSGVPPQTRQHLSLESLRMFLILSEVKSITQTAQIINKSQPAVSIQLKNLEERLKTKLFNRNGSLFELNQHGQILKSYANDILTLNDNIFDIYKNETSLTTLRIGIPNDIAFDWTDILTEFNKSESQIHIKLYEDLSANLLQQLHEDKIDIAVTISDKLHDNYCLHSEKRPQVWIANKTTPDINWQDIPLLVCFSGCTYRKSMETALKQSHIPYHIALTTNNIGTIKYATIKGCGISSMLYHPVFEENSSEIRMIDNNRLPRLPELYLGLHIKKPEIRQSKTQLIRQLINRIGAREL